MKFLHHMFSSSKQTGFDNLQGYDDIKHIVRRALDTEDNYNLLFIGPPASAKTLFLLGILDMRKDGVYFDGSNTTNRILNVLEEKRPKIICIDELDKMHLPIYSLYGGVILRLIQSSNYNRALMCHGNIRISHLACATNGTNVICVAQVRTMSSINQDKTYLSPS